MKIKLPSAFSLVAVFALFSMTLPVPAQTVWGNALSFDGVDDYVQSQQPVDLANRSFSIEAWAQRRSSDTMDLVVGQGYGAPNQCIIFGFHRYAGNQFLFDFYGNGVGSGTEDTDTAWHHWAGTYDATTKRHCLYRDGVLLACNTNTVEHYQGSGPLKIGVGYFGEAPNEFDGQVDEVRIWGVARSQAEIQDNMLRPLSGSEANLLAYWNFNEATGTSASDSTPNGFHATLINDPTWTASTLPQAPTGWGNALSFDGVNDYVTFSRPVADDFTLECWFRTTQTFGSGSGHWWDGAGLVDGEVNGGMHDFGVSLGAGKVLFGTGGSVDLTIRSPNAVNDGQWHHVAATRQKSNGAMQLFVDGALVASGANASGVSLNTPSQMRLGSLASGVSFFSGQIDEVRIWSQVRSADQIREGLCHPLTGYEPGLAAYLRLDEETGTIAFDATANHIDGTLVGGPVQQSSTIPAFINVTASVAPGLRGVGYSSVAWGDYDNDGRLDILLTGTTNYLNGEAGAIAEVWRNTGNGFSNINAGLPGVIFGTAAWGDYNNDGRLDILLAGMGVGYRQISQVWSNTGAGFVNINAGLPGVWYAESAWGDYDNDGRLDILLAGEDTNYNAVAQIWRNTGSGFTNINAGLPGVDDGAAAWGDYDNDGWLDILLTSETGPFAQVWRNTGSGFVNINAGLPGMENGSAAWGDYDNDGRLDILLRGEYAYHLYTAQLWRNTGGGFTNINVPLPALFSASVAWGDYDNDGLLDLLFTGGYPGTPSVMAQIWRNTGAGFSNIVNVALTGVRRGDAVWGDYDNDGRLDILLSGTDASNVSITRIYRNIVPVADTPPWAPIGLTEVAASGGILLGWSPATDGQTPADGLTYNLRVGTTPGGSEIVSPQAASNGFRRVPALGNAQYGQTARLSHLPWGVYYWSVQAVDTAFAGSPFTNEARFVLYPPRVETLPAIEVTAHGATLMGAVNPMEQTTFAWFEYGLTTKYGDATPPVNVGLGPDPVAIGNNSISGLLPWMTYHYRAVASNGVGRTDGPDMTFTLPGPSLGTLSLSPLSNVTLPQGGSTQVVFTALPVGVNVRVRCNNPVLLPPSGLTLGGSAPNYTLDLAPDPLQSGSAQVTVIASDGTRAVTQTFTLTVTPLDSDPTRLLYLTSPQPVSPEAWQFRIVDFGTASTNYAVEYRSHLSPTNTWIPATNVTDLTGGLYQVNTGPPQGGAGFYRVKGLRWLTAGLDSPATVVDESAACGAVIAFNGLYTGNVSYSWGGTQGTNTGTIWVNGTTAVIPIPASFVSDNAHIDALRYLTLRLGAGLGFALAGVTESSITVEEDDADWQGVLQTASGSLSFVLTIQQTNHSLLGQLKNDGFGFFPTNALAQLTFTENTFTAVATNIPLPALAGSPLLGAGHRVDLRLDAANGQTNQSVSPTQIQGVATMVTVVPGQPHLDTAIQGTFLVLRPPTTPSTNEVPLYPTR